MVKKLEPALSPAFPPETPPVLRLVFGPSITDTQPSVHEEGSRGTSDGLEATTGLYYGFRQ